MTIFCTGELTNNGQISMTARGARSEGQNIFLWKNLNGSYEIIPKEGASGGNEKIVNGTVWFDSVITDQNYFGNNGENGIDRKTGGGGSGSAQSWRGTGRGETKSSKGGNGTSYSGGSGSGGIRIDVSGNSNNYYSQLVSNNGGPGGDAFAIQGNSSNVYSGGGAGNPGGNGKYSTGSWNQYNYSSSNGGNGTGGLIIVYSNELTNNGTIESNGSDSLPLNSIALKGSGGGGSGAGSINIFTKRITGINNIYAIGGKGGYLTTKGGNGGNGSIVIGDISSGSFEQIIKDN